MTMIESGTASRIARVFAKLLARVASTHGVGNIARDEDQPRRGSSRRARFVPGPRW